MIQPRRLIPWIPAAALTAYYLVAEWIIPFPFYSPEYDPEMAYFMNSLALFKGVPYTYVDHPGTPIEVVGSLLLAVTRPWTRAVGSLFIPFHLANPRVFLVLAHGLVTLASVGCAILLARKAVAGDSLRAVLESATVAITFFAAFPGDAFGSLTLWSHNSFAFPGGTLALAAWTLRLRRGTEVTSKEALVAGAMAGLLTSIQLYFLAWGFGLLVGLALYGWLRGQGARAFASRAAAAALGLAAGFYVGFAPALFRLREFVQWIDRLLFRQARYGGGPEGVVASTRWLGNLHRLWQQSPWIFILTGIVLGLLLVAMREQRDSARRHPAWWASACGLLSMLALLLWAIGVEPGPRYLISVAAVLPLLLGLALEILVRRERWPRALATGTGGLIAVAFTVGAVMSVIQQARTARQISAFEVILDRVKREYAARLGTDPARLRVLWGYGAPSRCFALRYGDLHASLALQAEIDAICPSDWAYEVWGGRVAFPGADTLPIVHRPWDLIVMSAWLLPLPAEDVGEVRDTGVPTAGFGTIQILFPVAAP